MWTERVIWALLPPPPCPPPHRRPVSMTATYLAPISGKVSINYTSVHEDPTASETGKMQTPALWIPAPIPGICPQNELVHLETVYLRHLIDILITRVRGAHTQWVSMALLFSVPYFWHSGTPAWAFISMPYNGAGQVSLRGRKKRKSRRKKREC